jgi:predicted DNA binding protein
MRAVELQLLPEGGAFPGVDQTIADLPAVEREALTNLGWHSDGSYTLLYRLRAPAVDPLRAALDGHEDVKRYELVEEGKRLYTFLHVSEREALSELLSIAEEHALMLDLPFQFTSQGVRVTVAGEEEALQAAFAAATDRIAVDVEWTGGYSPGRPSALNRLTERQREALTTAYEMGYYEKPRAVSFEEVAAELDCASSTANELLRRAEATVVDAVLAE